MKALKVNFAPRWRVPRWIWGVLIALMTMIATDQIRRGLHNAPRARALRLEVDALAAQLDGLARAHDEARARLQVQPPYAKDALDIAKTASFGLPKVLGSLEEAQVEGVRVTAVEASAADGTVKAELEFSAHEGLLRYLEEINAGEPRRRWSLVQAQSSAATGLGAASIMSHWTGED